MNGVLFGSKHSYDEWGLLLAERPIISPPKVKSNYIDVPYANGKLDATEMFGDIKYDDREIKMKFVVKDDRKKWSEIYSSIQDFLHGQKMKIIFDEDTSYYYEGRCEVDDWASSKVHSTIVINATVYPYKLERFTSLEAWKWDSFNFETDIIRDYADIVVDGSYSLEIKGRRMQVIPTFTCSGSSLEVEFEGNTYTLPLGTSQVLNIVLKEGFNTLTFKGNGVVSVLYQGGRL